MGNIRYVSYVSRFSGDFDGKVKRALEIVGGTAERHIKEITPVDTGRLRNSIAHEPVDDRTMMVGTDVEYAPYVELGTRYQRPQPYIRPGVENHQSEYERIIRTELEM